MLILSFSKWLSSINEGGNTFQGTRSIKPSELKSTYKWIENNVFKLLNLETNTNALPIGSFMKKDSDYGDIDVAILKDSLENTFKLSGSALLNALSDKLQKNGYQTLISHGFNQVSVEIPIEGDYSLGTCQLDLMISSNLEWSEFAYWSPNFLENESQYKGVYRNLLLGSIVTESSKEILKRSDKNEIIEYRQLAIKSDKGLFSMTKSFAGSKSLLKNAKTIFEEFITNVPDELILKIFGPSISKKHLNTFESLWNLFEKTFMFSKEIKENIIKKFIKELESRELLIPKELLGSEWRYLIKN